MWTIIASPHVYYVTKLQHDLSARLCNVNGCNVVSEIIRATNDTISKKLLVANLNVSITNLCKLRYDMFRFVEIVDPLPMFTPEEAIGLPSVRPSVCPSVRLSAKNMDPLITLKLLKLGA